STRWIDTVGTLYNFRPRRARRAGGGSRLFAKGCDVGQIPILSVVVESVPYDELVRDREPDVVHRDVDFTSPRLVQQADGAQHSGPARAQPFLEVGDRAAGVHDVFDDQHVLAANRNVHVPQDPQLGWTGCVRPVAGDRREIEGDLALHVADEIGRKHERAVQDDDDRQRARKVGLYLDGELSDTATNLLLGNNPSNRCHRHRAEIISWT